ncbi:unnamed protein product [Rhizopus microsporus]|nr:hypothetical protein RMCBS344292_11376 [Rhizopus microsporus]
MCDTNWCTFCDCAVSPHLNTIYCSEECFRKDAQSHLCSTLIAHEEELIKQYSKNNHHRRRRNSNSSISSDDLAAIHLDLMSSSSSRPLLLSDSSSVASSQSIETPRLLHKITWNK